MQCCAVHSTCLYTTARQNPVARQHLCSLSISVAPLQPFKQCITPVNTLSIQYPGNTLLCAACQHAILAFYHLHVHPALLLDTTLQHTTPWGSPN